MERLRTLAALPIKGALLCTSGETTGGSKVARLLFQGCTARAAGKKETLTALQVLKGSPEEVEKIKAES